MERLFLVAIMSLGILFTVLHLFFILPREIAHLARSMQQHLLACLRARKERNELDAAVDARIFEWQKNQFHWAVSALSLLLLYMVAVLLATFLLGWEDVPNLQLSVPSQSNTRQILSIFVSYGSTLLVIRYLTRKNIDFFFWLLAVPVIAFKSPLLCNGTCEVVVMERIAMQLLLVGRMDGLHTAIAGAAFCVAGASGRFFGADVSMVRFDAVATVMALLLGWFLRRRTRAEARAVVESELLQQQLHAMQALLKMFYDAVLEVDGELRVAAGAAELSAFLLQGGDGARLHGRQLQDFLLEEQREQVAQRLLQSPSGNMAEVVHAQMRSADGDLLEVELFSFSFLGPMGTPRHLLGLREYGDELHGVPRRGGGEAARAAEDEVSLLVDTSDPRLAVVWASAAFQFLVCPAPKGASLESQLCQGLDFSMWLQGAVNDLPNRHSGLSASVPLCKDVSFRAMGGMQARARCSLEELRDEDAGFYEEVAEEGFLARLVFTQIERQRCRSSSHGSTVSGSSRSRSRANKASTRARPVSMTL